MGFCGCRRPSADDPHVIFSSVDVPLLERVIRVIERQSERIREHTRSLVE
jgi:hypothetical protein